MTEKSLSVDLRHIREIPKISNKLVEGQGARVLFIGNSLTRRGINAGTFQAGMAAEGIGPLSVQKVTPDASNIGEWYYLFKGYFLEAGHLPDFLLIGGGAWHLDDDERARPNTLANYYTTLRDIPDVFKMDVIPFPDRVEYVLSFISTAFANRERVSRRALDALVPGYRPAANRINEVLKRSGKLQPAAPTARSYHRLERLLALAKKHNVEVIVYILPVPSHQEIDPQMKHVIENFGARLIDCQLAAGIEETNFPDGYHLDEAGANICSRYLAGELAPLFARFMSTDKFRAQRSASKTGDVSPRSRD